MKPTCLVCSTEPGTAFDNPICLSCHDLGFRYCPAHLSICFDPTGAGIWIAPLHCHHAEH